MRRIQLITLDCALVVAEEGSFLGASRRMGIHHSALSRRIRDLEHSLGTVLFQRHAGGVRPTPAGMKLLHNLRRVLADLDGTLALHRRLEADRLAACLSTSMHSSTPSSSCKQLPSSFAAGRMSPSASWKQSAAQAAYPELVSRRARLKARSVVMNRCSIGAISFAGSATFWSSQ